jgi:hypothetical protein
MALRAEKGETGEMAQKAFFELMNPKAIVTGLSQAEARTAIEAAPAYKACDPGGGSGVATLKMKISAAGAVTAIEPVGSGASTAFAKCVVEAVRNVQFPAKGVETSFDVEVRAIK